MSRVGKERGLGQLKLTAILRTSIWILLAFIIIFGLVALIAWNNRAAVAESQIKKMMQKQGYSISLDIEKLTKNQIIMANIELRKDADLFFKSKRLHADFNISERTLNRLVLQKPNLKLSVDTNGRITSNWLTSWLQKPEKDAARKLPFPPRGVIIENGQVDWLLVSNTGGVVGRGLTVVSGDFISKTKWNASFSNKPTDKKIKVKSDMLSVDFTHEIYVETSNGRTFGIKGSFDATSLRWANLPKNILSAKTLSSQFKFKLDKKDNTERFSIAGWATANGSDIGYGDYYVHTAQVGFDNILVPQTGLAYGLGNWSGNWQINASGAQISDTALRTGFADKLTAYSALKNTPIAQHFALNLYEKADRLLSGFDLRGQGTFANLDTGYRAGLSAPLLLTSKGQALSFVTNPGSPFVNLNENEKTITLQSDLKWTGVRALDVGKLIVVAKSANGLAFGGLRQIRANVRSTQEWTTRAERQIARLSPFAFDLAYQITGANSQLLNVTGGIKFDGPVPGSTVRALEGFGALKLKLSGVTGGKTSGIAKRKNFILGFTPAGPIRIDELVTASGWTAKSLVFDMAPTDNVLAQTPTARPMRARLNNVSGEIVAPEGLRHLNMRIDQMDMHTDFMKSPLNWHVLLEKSDITSEDFPAPGTHIVSDNAVLDVQQMARDDLVFNLLSPDTKISTDNVSVSDLYIELGGDPDNIALDYTAGSVAFVGGTVPVLPLHGKARLMSGVLNGHAITDLPGTENTPIDIKFSSQDGQGSAKIIIPKIVFSPSGLQPQQLVPMLRGKLAEVSGEVSAEFEIKFGGGNPVTSSGWANLNGLNIGTLVGPLSGVDAKLKFVSIFPLETDGIQIATLAEFDPGIPLKDGTIKFEIIKDGIALHQALWPIVNSSLIKGVDGTNTNPNAGSIFITPIVWRFGGVENQVIANVKNVELGTILANIGKEKLSATGHVSGTLPARINGVNIMIEDGVLAVNGGGIIKFKSAGTDAAAARSDNVGHAFKALENFTYRKLEVRIDGPLDGNMSLGIVFDGHNPDVLSGQSFQFATSVSGELATIARNMAGAFSNEENLARVMAIKNGDSSDAP